MTGISGIAYRNPRTLGVYYFSRRVNERLETVCSFVCVFGDVFDDDFCLFFVYDV